MTANDLFPQCTTFQQQTQPQQQQQQQQHHLHHHQQSSSLSYPISSSPSVSTTSQTPTTTVDSGLTISSSTENNDNSIVDSLGFDDMDNTSSRGTASGVNSHSTSPPRLIPKDPYDFQYDEEAKKSLPDHTWKYGPHGSKKRPSKGSANPPPRKRTTRACDQCNHLRTKCDGKNPCAHCIEVKLECGYKRVPLKRGKASQTYIESAKEKKAAAAAAAKADFIPTEIPDNTRKHLTADHGFSNITASDQDTGNEFPKSNTLNTTQSSHQLSQMNNNFSQFSLNSLSRFQPHASDSNIPNQHQSDIQQPDETFYLSGDQAPNNIPSTSTSFLPTPTSDVTPESSVNPLLFPPNYENPSPQNEIASTKSKSTSANPEQYQASMDTSSLMFESALSPNGGWLFNLGSSFPSDQAQQQQQQQQRPQQQQQAHGHISIHTHGQDSSVKLETASPIVGVPVSEVASLKTPSVQTSDVLKQTQTTQFVSQSHRFSQQRQSQQLQHQLQSQSQFLDETQHSTPMDDSEAIEKLGLLMQSSDNNYRFPQNPNLPQRTPMANMMNFRTTEAPPLIPPRVTSTAVSSKQYKFPILRSVEHLIAPFPMALAQDLLESYFSHSTHVLAYLVRKNSILSPTNPRPTSPALLFSFLLVSAHHSDNPVLTGAPTTRKNIIDRLTDLTLSNLTTVHNITPEVTLDDVITYIQLGTIVSASEFKGYSLRFWAAAWALGKELKLNLENPDLPEETREEQRRTWWLLYMVDRHLGLCYNRPLAILDSEATLLYRPLEDSVWHSDAALTPAEMDPGRLKGLCHFVTGQGLFGYFLPLMTILGSLLELHHLQQNPIMPLVDVDRNMKPFIRGYLEQYTASLKNWNAVPCSNIYENAWRDYAFQISHVLHILALVPWDPLELMNSPESMMVSPEFNEALNHAISASKHIRRILTMDADLMLMPFFFGIYLLHSSFVLLYIVDQVESDASHDVFAACETIVHAHEVCVVTLNTEYQRNFRRIMRATINLLNSDNAQKNTPSSTASGSPMCIQGMDPKAVEDKANREKEEARNRRKDVLGLYRWTSGSYGLAV